VDWDQVALDHHVDKASRYHDHPGHNYMRHYQHHLDGLPIRSLLEIGVWYGDSMRMWRDLLPDAYIYGVDIDPACTQHRDDRISVVTGDQGDAEAMRVVGEAFGPFDVIVDDGSHNPTDVLTAYTALAPHCRRWYFIEDLPAVRAAWLIDQLDIGDVTVYASDWPDDQARTLIAI
jgi:hypothetical protein